MKTRTYADYYRAYVRALLHGHMDWAAKLHEAAHEAARRDQSRRDLYRELILAACG